VRRLLALVLVASLGVAACGSDDGGGESGSVAAGVEEQLAYLHPDSSLVVAIDLRYEEENWESLRGIAGRVLDEARQDAGPDNDVPADAEAALTGFARSWNLSFEEDVRPVLNGRLVIGVAQVPVRGDPPERVTVVYRTEGGDLGRLVEKTLDNSPLRPLPGRDDVVITSPEGIALVGDDTLVAAETREEAISAIERADAGEGFSTELIDAAERGAGIEDPLVLATATPDLAAQFVDGVAVERALSEVPYLGAVERVDLALDANGDGVEARAQVATTGASLRPDQLPLGPAGEVELPRAEKGVAGGSLDQSRITTFAASVMRSLFADSEFVAAV
jgi:hypothetical protein